MRSLEREGQVKPVVRTLGGCPLYALSQVEDIRKADVEARELEAYAAWYLEAGERN